jgi:class 3 adenylate cyclase/alpha-beta hydrolase superfamily lysophospholipase
MADEVPETQYAKVGNVHIAYQVVGSGPIDLVLIPEWFTHVEAAWDVAPLARTLRRLGSFSRLILFDKGGSGLSDPVSLIELPSLEVWIEEVQAVMDAAESEQAAVLAEGGGGPMAITFAATHPERVSALVLANSFARITRGPDYPFGLPINDLVRFPGWLKGAWGTGRTLPVTAPSAPTQGPVHDAYRRLERVSASPGTVEAIMTMVLELDVSPVLPTIVAPTLVINRCEDRVVPAEHGRYLAEHIPSAQYVEVPGEDHHYFFGDADALNDEVQEFLTGVRPPEEPDRVLATLLFVDVVDSTQRAVQAGDRRWHSVLDDLHALLRRQAERFRGRVLKGTGDGALVMFDGPARAIQSASATAESVRGLDLEVRCGLHTGEVELLHTDVGGYAVNLAARVVDEAKPGEVLVSRTVVDLVKGSGLRFEDRGTRSLKGVPEEWQLFALA